MVEIFLKFILAFSSMRTGVMASQLRYFLLTHRSKSAAAFQHISRFKFLHFCHTCKLECLSTCASFPQWRLTLNFFFFLAFLLKRSNALDAYEAQLIQITVHYTVQSFYLYMYLESSADASCMQNPFLRSLSSQMNSVF